MIFVVIIALAITVTAFADIKPVGDAWENPDILVENGEGYFTKSPYVAVWEKPECNVDGEYLIVEEGLPVTITATLAYRNEIPWGKVQIECGKDANGEPVYYEGWVLMSDLLDKDGNPAYVAPNTSAEASAQTAADGGSIVSVSNSYNSAIVFSCLAIAAGAIALVAYVLIKHQAINTKSE